MPIKNQVQLITYPDSMGGDLKTLHELLDRHFTDIFPGGVHILPPYPSSADRGFAPTTYFEIDPKFGSWADLQRIGAQFDVLVDLMVNHISRQSSYFQDFKKKGRRSEYVDLFITLDKVWPDGDPPQEDVARIFLRRPEQPFISIRIEETGEVERIWATFGTRDWAEQIDLDVHSPVTRKLFTDILAHFSRQGVNILRLDAIAYVIKKAGTSCFFVEPEIFDFLNWIKGQAQSVGIELLLEVHADHALQDKLAESGYWVYNFVLPLLILHTLLNCSSETLQDHLRSCPRDQFTMLDCHDGIPVQPDLDGILDIDKAQKVVQSCLQGGANLNRILSAEHMRRADFDAHQINCTYYSALNLDDDAYLTARAIQFFSPGVPQVYYVGLLAGENDQAEVIRTGEGRAINRRNYTVAEVEQALNKPVVQRLLKLIRFRNEYPAFNGNFTILESSDHQLNLSWEKGSSQCVLKVDLPSSHSIIEYNDSGGGLKQYQP
jgi:sucrose 6(F)-phosphate phosphorylase